MSSETANPQIGPFDVDAETLLGEGESLRALLDQLGAELEHRSDDDVPADGWRVLRRQSSGDVTIGAPVSASPDAAWRIGQIGTDQHGAPRLRASIHPESFPVRRSPAARARGLALRWPQLSQDEAADGVFVIDVVNTGGARWRPEGDPFHVIGFITRPGAKGAGASFGFFGGHNLAVPLDPGEYARVRVSINEAQWATLEPGRHELHATLAMLPVKSAEPLLLDLTQQQINERTPRSRPRGRDDSAWQMRRAILVAYVTALERADELLAVCAAVTGDAAATRSAVEKAFGFGPEQADAVLALQVSRFAPIEIERIRQELVDLDRQASETERG